MDIPEGEERKRDYSKKKYMRTSPGKELDIQLQEAKRTTNYTSSQKDLP